MFGFAAAIPGKKTQLRSERPNELSAAILPAPQFRLDSKSTRRNFVAQTNAGWSIVNSSNAFSTQGNSIEGITCLSASDCWAVGYGYPGRQIEHWNGTSWSIVSSSGAGGGLTGVTCVSASDCWAVGSDYSGNNSHTLVEHWNGTSWSIIASPNTSTSESNYLNGVTCASASDCWAVGDYYTGNEYRTLIERWNGISWSIVISPNNTNAYNQLYGVVCAAASECWAVGTLIEHWDGSSWAIVTAPSGGGSLQGVTCNSASDCWADGERFNGNSYHYETFIEHWDGSAWSIIASPNANTLSNRLFNVTCASTTDCWAVGYYYTGGVTQTLIEHWDGSVWAIITSPNISTTNDNELFGVACTSSNCWAVGAHHAAIEWQTLTEQWNGTSWVIVSSPNTGGTTPNEILALTCTSALDCTAVGYYNDTYYNDPLIERWNGSSWSDESFRTSPVTLSGVACTSASECWAVGYSWEYFEGIHYYRDPVSVRWDGSSWEFYWLYGGGGETFLNSVACASASDCWAVGYSGSSDYPNEPKFTFITHQNGAGWATVTSPNVTGADNSVLRSVTCVSTSDCWAVGNDRTDTNVHTLIEHWNGSSWAIVPSPNASSINLLTSVACGSGSDCWAAGFATMSSGIVQTLIEHWNGSAWLVVASLNTDITRTNELKGMSCASASDCWAVGDYVNNAGAAQTLTEHWNGSAWSIIDSPNTSSTRDNKLNAVSCAPSANCWAAGSYINESGIAQTLIERWTGPLQLVSAVSRKTHGAAGTFDINLPVTGNLGVECRAGGASGSYQVIATLGPAVTMNEASVLAGTGSIDSTTVNGSEVTVNLSGVTNGQTIVIRIDGVNDGAASNIDIPMGVLFGDVTGNGVVNSSDISTTKKLSGQAVGPFAFRTDLNANGVTNSSDLGAVKVASGTTLP